MRGDSPRVGLVLGAGGVMGGAWLTGALHALAQETGWDPASADYVVGTSAGAMIGSLCASGVPPWFMVAHSGGERFDGLLDAIGRPAEEADRSGGAVFRLERALPPIGPGSLKLALKTLRSPGRHSPGALVSGWLPRGVISTAPLKETIRRAVPAGWSPHPRLWVVACDYATGERVVFGREGSPRADLADAVAASCAIPGFYHPVAIAGRRYVDGGIHSPSNLDLMRAEALDKVICLNPTSSLTKLSTLHPVGRAQAFLRSASGRRLGSEARTLRDAGVEVVLIQPGEQDLDAMGGNLMSRSRRHEVIEVAIATVTAALRSPSLRRTLSDLPPGEPGRIAKPDGPPSTWPRYVRAGASGSRASASSISVSENSGSARSPAR
jgi:NTE family protein